MKFKKSKNLNLLIEGCKRGNPRDQETLYKNYYGFGLSVCLRYANNENDAKELLNMSFLKVFKKIDQVRDSDSFTGWLKRIIINTSIDMYRKNSKMDMVSLDENDSIESPDDENDGELSQEDILITIQELPEIWRMVFNLYVFEGLKHKEIASELNISEGVSRAYLAKANKQLREKIRERIIVPFIVLLAFKDNEFYGYLRRSIDDYNPAFNARHWQELKLELGNKPLNETAITYESGFIDISSNVKWIAIVGGSVLIGCFLLMNGQQQLLSTLKRTVMTNGSEYENFHDPTNDSLLIGSAESDEKLKSSEYVASSPLEYRKIDIETIHLKSTIRNEPIEFIPKTAIIEGASPLDMDELREYIKSETTYPDTLKFDPLEGQVYVSFAIDENGKPCEIKIAMGLHELIDEEAIRVIRNMPLWNPAKVNGEPIKSKRFQIPILFEVPETSLTE